MKTEALNEILDRSLKAEPEFRLPPDFANKVTATLVRREQWKSDLTEYFYLVACLVLLVMVATAIYYFADNQYLIRAIAFLKSNFVPVTFVVLILNFILLADRVLLRLLFTRWKS